MVRRKKNGSWVVELRIDGEKRHIRAGDYGMRPPKSAREAYKLEEAAQAALQRGAAKTATCDGFAERWTERYPRGESTNAHNHERVKAFGQDFKGRTMRSVTREEARDWALANRGRLPAVRAMFNDARGDGIVDYNPFAKLGFKGSRGRKDITVLTEPELDDLVAKAREVHPGQFGREFASMIVWAAYTCMRPGEVFDARWGNLTGDEYDVDGQWHSKLGKVTEAKHGGSGVIYVPPPALAALEDVPRRLGDDLIFHSKTGKRMTAGTLFYSWEPVRAAAGRPGMDFYELRHRGASYMLNELELEPWLIAQQMRHKDAGQLVIDTYGHPRRQRALGRIRDAYRGDQAGKIVPLRGTEVGTGQEVGQ